MRYLFLTLFICVAGFCNSARSSDLTDVYQYIEKQKFDLAIPVLLEKLADKPEIDTLVCRQELLLGRCYVESKDWNLALPYLQSALQHYQTKFPDQYRALAETTFWMADAQYSLGQYMESANTAQLGVAYITHLNKFDSEITGKLNYFIGSSKVHLGQFLSAIDTLQIALEYFELAPNPAFQCYSHKGLSFAYLQLSNVDQALLHVRKAIQYNEQTEAELADNLYGTLAAIYNRMGKNELAVTNMKKAIETIPKIPRTLPNRATMYLNLGSFYTILERWEDAEQAFLMSEELATPLGIPKLDYVILYKKGGVAYRLNNAEQGMEWLDESMQQAAKYQDVPVVVAAAFELSNLFFEDQQYEQALKHWQRGYAALMGDLSLESKGFDGVVDISKIPPSINNVKFLAFRGSCLYQIYRTKKDLNVLRQAEQILQQSRLLLCEVRKTFRNDAWFSKASINQYELLLNVLYDLYTETGEDRYLNTAFQLAEQTKYLTFLNELQRSKALRIQSIPDSIAVKRDQLKRQQAVWQEQLFWLTNGVQDTTKQEIYACQDSLFVVANQLTELQTYLEENYPAYRDQQYQYDYASTTAVVKKLANPKTAVIEYFMGEKDLFAFLILEQHQIFFRFDNLEDLNDQIVRFRSLVGQPPQNTQATQELFDLNQALSEKFWIPILEKIPQSVDRLIVVPDPILALIPFEVLFEQLPTAQEPAPYAIKKYGIGYLNSASLLFNQEVFWRNHGKRKNLAAFAATYEENQSPNQGTVDGDPWTAMVRSGNVMLPGAMNEAKEIVDLWNGDLFLGEQCTEGAFKDTAVSYQILHLAMHALSNKEFPMFSKLIFSDHPEPGEDGFLHAIELYQLPMNADVVVLSACNTGYGKVERGEGILSLAYAFQYAGVESTIMTLWQIPDLISKGIIVDFYKNLKSGKPKDLALKQAKLNYLDSVKDPLGQHPYYWAGYVAYGNQQALTSYTTQRWFIGLMVLLILTLFWWGWRQVTR